MRISIVIIIVILVLFVYIVSSKQDMAKPLIEGYTFNGRMAIDDQYFYDRLFDDVTYYPDEYNEDNEVMTGWNRCVMECPGHCVEFGVTGNSYCFPY